MVVRLIAADDGCGRWPQPQSGQPSETRPASSIIVSNLCCASDRGESRLSSAVATSTRKDYAWIRPSWNYRRGSGGCRVDNLGRMVGRSYHVTTFGCQMNEHDSERMKGMLESLGTTRCPSARRLI